MLIKFKSQESGSIVMFGEVAKKLIAMMGFSKDVPGAIKAKDVPTALKNLEKELNITPKEDTKETLDTKEQNPKINIHLRAAPLISLLKSAIDNDSYILWEKTIK